jgi:capsular polysaccharide biosynthesis protein
MEWRVPSFPHEVRDEPTVEVVDGAFLTRYENGPLRTVGMPHRYLRGAVHDRDGRLVVTSQKIGGTNGHPWVPADPARVRVDERSDLLSGRWLYGGHWIQHFGHFVVETVSTLWPAGHEPAGLVFHKYLRRPVVREDWMLRLLELAGYGGLPVEVVNAQRDVRVEQLVVPSRSVVANGWGHPQAREVWERIVAPFRGGGDPRRVLLSRTAFNEAARREGAARVRSSRERDQAIDRAFAARGFEVVAPETLAIDDQLRLVADAEIVAGGSGSALHLTAFAPRGTRVVEVGDERNPHEPIGLQRVVDRLGGHPHAFLGGDLTVAELDREIRSIDD